MAARVFVGAKGSLNLPPRAQRRIWAGQIAALEGSDATLLIGHSRENLKGMTYPFRKDGTLLSGRKGKIARTAFTEYGVPQLIDQANGVSRYIHYQIITQYFCTLSAIDAGEQEAYIRFLIATMRPNGQGELVGPRGTIRFPLCPSS